MKTLFAKMFNPLTNLELQLVLNNSAKIRRYSFEEKKANESSIVNDLLQKKINSV